MKLSPGLFPLSDFFENNDLEKPTIGLDLGTLPWYPGPMLNPLTVEEWPKISLVMPNLNYAKFLGEAIESILSQGYPNLEFIMVDGGSNDGSLEIINKYQSSFSETIIGPDEGQADAINKGLEKASGEIFQWINSDDILEPNALFSVARGIKGHDAVAGICTDFDASGTQTPVKLKRLSSGLMIRHPVKVTFHQPALWLRTEGVRACGGIDPRFHYMFDYDLTVRYLDLFPRVRYINDPLVRFRLHSRSKTTTSPSDFQRERREIVQKLAQHGSSQLRRLARRMTARIDWWDRLTEIQDLPTPPMARGLLIVRETLRHPSTRFGRGTVKALRRLLTKP